VTLPAVPTHVRPSARHVQQWVVLVQLLREAGTLLMQREVPEDVNLQAAQVS
jgi:hypothetical protein